LPTRTAIKVKSRREIISGVARKRYKFDLGHEMNRLAYQKKSYNISRSYGRPDDRW